MEGIEWEKKAVNGGLLEEGKWNRKWRKGGALLQEVRERIEKGAQR